MWTARSEPHTSWASSGRAQEGKDHDIEFEMKHELAMLKG
jgi:hypothetical protein